MAFHDWDVLFMELANDTFVLRLGNEYASVEPKLVTLRVDGVREVLVDKHKSSDLKGTILDSGEILTVELDDTELFVLIEWHCFKTRKNITHSYRIKGEKVEIAS